MAPAREIPPLTFAFIDPSEAKLWVDYYETLERECVPIGHAVNPNVAMVTGFSCHPDGEEARRRGRDGFRFFQFALAHHCVFGTHTPGRTNIWERFLTVRDRLGAEVLGAGTGCIATPAGVRQTLATFAQRMARCSTTRSRACPPTASTSPRPSWPSSPRGTAAASRSSGGSRRSPRAATPRSGVRRTRRA